MSTVILTPLCTLQRSVEWVDSDEWQRQQLHRACVGQLFKTRLEHVASLEQTTTFFSAVDCLYGEDERWKLLPPEYCCISYSSLAVAMLSVSECGISALMFWNHSSYPLRLFRLIRDPSFASVILRDCGLCMMSLL